MDRHSPHHSVSALFFVLIGSGDLSANFSVSKTNSNSAFPNTRNKFSSLVASHHSDQFMLQGKHIKKITVIPQKIKRLQNRPNFFLIGVFDSHRKGTPVIIIDLLSSYKALIFKDQSPLPPSPRGITRMTVIFLFVCPGFMPLFIIKLELIFAS
jgi:hypothetical protein